MPEGEGNRGVAECLDCGNAYAATKWPNGEVQPIGNKNGCQCGSTKFQIVEMESDTVFDETDLTDY